MERLRKILHRPHTLIRDHPRRLATEVGSAAGDLVVGTPVEGHTLDVGLPEHRLLPDAHTRAVEPAHPGGHRAVPDVPHRRVLHVAERPHRVADPADHVGERHDLAHRAAGRELVLVELVGVPVPVVLRAGERTAGSGGIATRVSLVRRWLRELPPILRGLRPRHRPIGRTRLRHRTCVLEHAHRVRGRRLAARELHQAMASRHLDRGYSASKHVLTSSARRGTGRTGSAEEQAGASRPHR